MEFGFSPPTTGLENTFQHRTPLYVQDWIMPSSITVDSMTTDRITREWIFLYNFSFKPKIACVLKCSSKNTI